jgi:S-layer family protein
MRFVRSVHIGFVMFMLPVAAMAQVISPTAKPFNRIADQVTAPNPETYGTSSETSIALDDFEFNPIRSSTTFDWNGGRFTTSSGVLEAGVHLPAGASITKIVVQACNSNPTNSGYVLIEAKPNNSPFGNDLALALIAANSGCVLTTSTLGTPHTVDNVANAYSLEWGNIPAFDGSIKLQAVRVYYKLQVSPNPATATFTDVPVGHPLHRFVEALYAAGITAGCGNGNYCPDQPVTRGQIAVFLAAALGLHWAP